MTAKSQQQQTRQAGQMGQTGQAHCLMGSGAAPGEWLMADGLVGLLAI